jgi:hypothetical protein
MIVKRKEVVGVAVELKVVGKVWGCMYRTWGTDMV